MSAWTDEKEAENQELIARGEKPLSRNSSARFARRQLDGSRPLWYKQPGESMQAYEAFMTYLMSPSGERTFSQTADKLGKSYSLMMKWGQQWSWTTRVGAYEEHYLLLQLESVEAKRDEMWAEQMTLAQMGLSIVGGHFQDLINEMKIVEDGKKKGNSIKPDALVRLFDTATKVQRMAVLGRIQSAAEVQERNETLAERFSEELVALIREVTNESGLDKEQQDKMNEVLKRHLTS